MQAKYCWLAISYLILFHGCASVGTPGGGPKDLRPPVLVSSNPANKQINFAGQAIELYFNEDILLNNAKEEIVISPSVGKNIDITAKGNRVTIRPHEPWKPDLTYSIQFREGIQDITEKNSPANLRLAFSTGSYLDSLHISGTIKDLLKGTPSDKTIVAIYPMDTFNIFKHSPSYFTKTNKRGQFVIENLHPGSYYLYAFADGNKNLKVDSKTENYGFIGERITLNQHADSVRIGMVRLDARNPKLQSARNNGHHTVVRLNKSVTGYTLESGLPLDHCFGQDQSELYVYGDFPDRDSLAIHLTATDSLLQQLDTVFYTRKNPASPITDKLKFSLGNPVLDAESGLLRATIQSSKLIDRLLLDSLYLQLDTVNRIAITKEDITVDVVRKKIFVAKTLDKPSIPSGDVPVLLTAGKGFIFTHERDTSQNIQAAITINRPENSGTILIETRTTEKHFILQLVNPDGYIVQSAQDVKKHTFRNVPPAEYQLRIVIDRNGNGKWDPGNFFLHEEPEAVQFYRTAERKFRFPVRANWELGPLNITF